MSYPVYSVPLEFKLESYVTEEGNAYYQYKIYSNETELSSGDTLQEALEHLGEGRDHDDLFDEQRAECKYDTAIEEAIQSAEPMETSIEMEM